MILVGQRVELLDARGQRAWASSARSRSTSCATRSARRCRSSATCTSTSARRTATPRKAAVRIGDVAVIAGEPVEVMGDRVISRSMDNRLGSYIALEAARLVAEDGGAPGDVAALGVVQEEITFAGARTSAFALQPDVAIAVDVTHATDAPGIDVKQEGKHEFGQGAVIERGSTLHPMVFELLHDAAEREAIPFTVSASARGTGTDADAIHFSRARRPDRARVDRPALHALPRRDGPALGRRRVRAAHRRVREVAVARDEVRALSDPGGYAPGVRRIIPAAALVIAACLATAGSAGAQSGACPKLSRPWYGSERPAHPDGHRRSGHLLRASRRTPARGVRLGQHDHQERHLRPDVLLDAAPRQGASARRARLDDDQHVHDARAAPARCARACGSLADPGEPLPTEHEHALRRRARLVPQGRGDDGRRRRVRRLRPSPHGGRVHLDVPAHGRAHAGDRACLGARRAQARAGRPQGATQKVGSGREVAWVRYYAQQRDLVRTLNAAGFDTWVISASPQEVGDRLGRRAPASRGPHGRHPHRPRRRPDHDEARGLRRRPGRQQPGR